MINVWLNKVKSLFFVLVFVFSFPCYAIKLTVNVEGIDVNKNGVIYVALCDKKSFLNKKVKCRYISFFEASGHANMKLSFDAPAGKYALQAYHDENNNKKLDTNWFGIPTEGISVSRYLKAPKLKPSFADCVFELKDSQPQTTENLIMFY